MAAFGGERLSGLRIAQVPRSAWLLSCAIEGDVVSPTAIAGLPSHAMERGFRLARPHSADQSGGLSGSRREGGPAAVPTQRMRRADGRTKPDTTEATVTPAVPVIEIPPVDPVMLMASATLSARPSGPTCSMRLPRMRRLTARRSVEAERDVSRRRPTVSTTATVSAATAAAVTAVPAAAVTVPGRRPSVRTAIAVSVAVGKRTCRGLRSHRGGHQATHQPATPIPRAVSLIAST